jgi:hypothetical protein
MATQVLNTRLLRDSALTITKALPATSSNNTTDTIDLGVGPFRPEEITVEISIPAIAAHVTAGNHINITLYHADTTTVIAPVAPVATITVDAIGVVSTGSLGSVWRFKLPIGTKRFIGFYQTTGATDTLSGSSVTYSILL